jgi:hypothetical protein
MVEADGTVLAGAVQVDVMTTSGRTKNGNDQNVLIVNPVKHRM